MSATPHESVSQRWTEWWWLRQVPARLERRGRRLHLVRYEWCAHVRGSEERGTATSRRAANRSLAAARARGLKER